MKKLIYITICFLILTAGMTLRAQNRDTIATVLLKNAKFTSETEVTFDLYLRNDADRWNKFANGTFEIVFSDNGKILDKGNYYVNYIAGSSDLPVSAVAGSLPVPDKYAISSEVRKDRISIIIAGPDSVFDCSSVPTGAMIKLGNFVLTAKNGAYLDNKLAWRTPYFENQACAFKLTNDSILIGVVPLAVRAQNLEMDNDGQNAVRYLVEDGVEPVFKLTYFRAIYAGAKKVRLEWQTSTEAYNKGFIIARGMKSQEGGPTVFLDTILDYRTDPRYVGLGTSEAGKYYYYEFDKVDLRDETYCYVLLNQDMRNESITELDTACVYIPNSVITSATPSPNPFSESTTIYYTVEDDVILTAKVFNLLANNAETIIDRKYVKRSLPGEKPYEVKFTAGDNASQGLFEAVFTASPVDDESVESSVAVVKMQMIRNTGSK